MIINVMPGTSQLAQRTIDHLLKMGANPNDIIASVRSPEKSQPLADKGLTIRKADYDNKDTLIDAFKNTDVLLLIPTFLPTEARIMQHFNALEAAKQNKVKRVVFASFIATSLKSLFEINPFMVYAETKTRQSRMDWSIVRDGMYLEPLLERLPEMLKTGKWPIPIRKGKIAYISKDDLGRAIAAVCFNSGHEGKTYSLTGPKAYSLDEITGYISDVSGTTVKYEGMSDETYIEKMVSLGRPEHLIHGILSLYHAIDAGECEIVTDHVEKITGTPAEHAESYFKREIPLLNI